jgi:hypothetical protein
MGPFHVFALFASGYGPYKLGTGFSMSWMVLAISSFALILVLAVVATRKERVKIKMSKLCYILCGALSCLVWLILCYFAFGEKNFGTSLAITAAIMLILAFTFAVIDS